MAHEGYGSVTHSVGSVTGTSSTVLAASTTCNYRRFQNASTALIHLAFSNGGAAAANTGIRLHGAGSADSIIEMSRAQGNLYQGPVTAITSSGTQILLISQA